MATTLTDLRPEAARVQFEMLRRAPSWRKMEMVAQMCDTVRALTLIGLRERHPYATSEELRRHLADLILGPVLAERVYGPWPVQE